jgi:hypothetical protein
VSPPVTTHVTAAAPPPDKVAENCSTEEPLAPRALHPVQLVSMDAVPGLMVNVPLLGLALTVPAPHPAKASIAGPASKRASLRKSSAVPRVGRAAMPGAWRRIDLAVTT